MSRPTVFACKAFPPQGIERLRKSCDVTVYTSSPITQDAFVKAAPGFDAVFVDPCVKVNKELLDAAGPQLKVVGTNSVGLEHIDLEECRKRGVKVGYTPGVLTNAVAEMAVSLTLAVARQLEDAFKSVRTGVWGTRWEEPLWMCGKQVSNSVIGIVGLGRIGMATATRLAAFQPSRIVYCGNSPKPGAESIKAEFVSFHELLQVSDFVIGTCAITETSKGLFNADAFRRMKPSAVFINVTRGALVDQDALYEALSTNQIAAAGLDVTTPEPLPTNHKLLTLPNCTVTPHIASATVMTRNVMCELTVDNILAGLQGTPLPSPAP